MSRMILDTAVYLNEQTEKFTKINPPEHLRKVVRYFWTLEGSGPGGASKTIGPLADGCPGIIVQNADHGIYYDSDQKQLPSVFLYGQTVTRTALHLTGRFRTLGVRFHPGAIRPVFGFDADELADSCLDLSLLPTGRYTSIAGQLLNTGPLQNQLELLIAYLTSQLTKTKEADNSLINHAVTQIISHSGNLPLKELHQQLDISERNLERRFRQDVGISPKLFSKICRFQAALTQIQRNDYTKLSDIAFDNGYADQSHFIRNFKQFAGVSPFRMIRPKPVVAEDFR